ncbi:MAG: ferrous iron transport protein B, partial [Actinomycetaceae bacterium]|nr:ferrous iron transport protein B [Actinomycetaceae bacterium]
STNTDCSGDTPCGCGKCGSPSDTSGKETADHIDLVLAILDGSSLTRSLYLLAQIGQTGLPVAVVMTMNDVAEADGITLDTERLREVLGVPLLAFNPRNSHDYGELDNFVREALENPTHLAGIEPDPLALSTVEPTADRASDSRADAIEHAANIFSWVSDVESALENPYTSANSSKLSYSDRIDRLLLHPLIGSLVFLGVIFVLFKIAGQWIGVIQDFFDALFSSTEPGAISFANGLAWLLERVGWGDTWFASLLIDGLSTGLGVVASFFPLMFIIYIALTILEDSGYMARVAFLGDRLMRKIGLDGRVILPLIMGFGCNLPSLAAARTLPSHAQRLVTVLITPYTSCAARLTIYLMIARIFFPEHAGTVVFAMYVFSIVLIVGGAWILKHFITRGESAAPLMLVLPAYHLPSLPHLLRTTWQRAWSFVTGAGKMIVAMTLVVWLLGAIPVGASPVKEEGGTTHSARFADPDLPMEESLYGRIAQGLEPVFTPTGFGEWHMMGALMTGFVAKETVVSSVVTSYNLEPEAAGDAEDNGEDLGRLPSLVNRSFTKSAGKGYEGLAAFAFLVFVLAYTPCMATVAEQAKIIGGKKTALAVLAQLAIAWVLAAGIFQIGRLFL